MISNLETQIKEKEKPAVEVLDHLMAIVMDITLHKPTWLESLVCEAPNGLVMLISLKFVLKVDPLKIYDCQEQN